jgi:hypothetical protein
MKKKPLFLSFAVAALLAALAGVVQSGGGLQEQTSKPVRPGSHHVLTNAFRAPNVPTNAPVLAHWKLHVPAAPRYYHRPKSQSPTWRGWVANFPTGCGDTGTFSCVVTTNNITELNFQYGFRGHVDPCPVEGVAGGGGDKGGAAAVPVEPEPLPPWLVDGKTTNSYFVLPSYTNVCLNGRVTFSAWNDQGEPVASTWTTAPSGLTPTSQTSGVAAVTYSATAPGQYTIKGVSDQDPSLADSATADVIKVEIKALDEPAALLCVGGTRRFKAEVTPQVQGVFVWSVNHPDKLGFVGGKRTAETIAVTGLVASAAVNAEELKVEFTPTAATFTCTATTNLTILKCDLDVDSDNNNAVANPDRNDTEDGMEEATGTGQYGKFVMVNQNDDDKDGIPDYSDLEVVASGSVSGSANEGQFVPLKLELQPDLDWSTVKVQFDYDGNASMDTTPFSGVDIGNGYKNYTGAKTGKIRIWKDCAPSDSRDALNYVLNGTEYTASALGFSDSANEKTFYIEGINPVEKSEITATVKIGTSFTCSDKVVVTVVDANLGVNCNNNLNNSDDMRIGIPDVEFVIDENDDIIEDQKDGFQFWWSRDDESTVSELGIVDLAPFAMNIPKPLFDSGFKFYLKYDGVASVHTYPGVNEASDLRQYLKTKAKADAQRAKVSEVVVVWDIMPTDALPITGDGITNFVFKALPNLGDDLTEVQETEGNLMLIAEEPDPASGPLHRVVVDSVRLSFKRTRDFYTMWSCDESEPDGSMQYQIEDGRVQYFDIYPEAVHVDSGSADTDKKHFLIHVHGYNVSLENAYGEIGENFRLYPGFPNA